MLNQPPGEDVHAPWRRLRNANTDFSGCTMSDLKPMCNSSTNNKVVPLFFLFTLELNKLEMMHFHLILKKKFNKRNLLIMSLYHNWSGFIAHTLFDSSLSEFMGIWLRYSHVYPSKSIQKGLGSDAPTEIFSVLLVLLQVPPRYSNSKQGSSPEARDLRVCFQRQKAFV